jgi:hypothetical protein
LCARQYKIGISRGGPETINKYAVPSDISFGAAFCFLSQGLPWVYPRRGNSNAVLTAEYAPEMVQGDYHAVMSELTALMPTFSRFCRSFTGSASQGRNGRPEFDGPLKQFSGKTKCVFRTM